MNILLASLLRERETKLSSSSFVLYSLEWKLLFSPFPLFNNEETCFNEDTLLFQVTMYCFEIESPNEVSSCWCCCC